VSWYKLPLIAAVCRSTFASLKRKRSDRAEINHYAHGIQNTHRHQSAKAISGQQIADDNAWNIPAGSKTASGLYAVARRAVRAANSDSGHGAPVISTGSPNPSRKKVLPFFGQGHRRRPNAISAGPSTSLRVRLPRRIAQVAPENFFARLPSDGSTIRPQISQARRQNHQADKRCRLAVEQCRIKPCGLLQSAKLQSNWSSMGTSSRSAK